MLTIKVNSQVYLLASVRKANLICLCCCVVQKTAVEGVTLHGGKIQTFHSKNIFNFHYKFCFFNLNYLRSNTTIKKSKYILYTKKQNCIEQEIARSRLITITGPPESNFVQNRSAMIHENSYSEILCCHLTHFSSKSSKKFKTYQNQFVMMYTQYPIIRNGDKVPLVGFFKKSPI